MTIREGWPCFEDWQKRLRFRKGMRLVSQSTEQLAQNIRDAAAAMGATTEVIYKAMVGLKTAFGDSYDELKRANEHINNYPAPYQEEADSPIRFPRRW